MFDMQAALELAQEFPLFRDRLMRAGLFATAQAMQPAQDMIAKEIERSTSSPERTSPENPDDA